MNSKYVLFPAIYIGGQLQKTEVDIKVDCCKVKIEGELRKQAWDPFGCGMKIMYGLFIEFGGIEYGTTKMTEQDFNNICQSLCCQGGNSGQRIHVGEFAIEFV